MLPEGSLAKEIRRVKTKQGHVVPSHSYSAVGPFPPNTTANPSTTQYVHQEDSGFAELPVGGTAQNNYREIQTLVCILCNTEVPENKTEDHEC